jgi:hypothetical protein
MNLVHQIDNISSLHKRGMMQSDELKLEKLLKEN